MLARTPVIFVIKRPWRRVVPAVRRMHALGRPHWEIAQRLRVGRKYIEKALKPGGGVWAEDRWERLTAALMREMER